MENKMLDRLVELCREAHAKYLYEEPPVGDFNVYIANYLFKNGAVIMPFEIGGLTYVIQDGGVIPARIESQYYVSKERKTNIFARSLDGECDWLFDIGDVDKTIFMSRYDAEQALKGEQHAKIH